jgi:putative ABC transport system permease protein
MIWNSVSLAFISIRRNILRSTLTILGIVIGVAAVITMVNMGRGATEQVGAQIASLGSNLLFARPGQSRGPGAPIVARLFDLDDAIAIEREIPSIEAVAPSSQSRMIAVYGAEIWSTDVIGTTNAFFAVRDRSLETGRLFTESESRGGSAVCLIGATVRENLYRREDPVGTRLRLGKISCEVIGLMASKGQAATGADQDDLIVIPLFAFWRRIAGNRDVNLIQFSAREGASTARIKKDVEELLRERRRILHGMEDDFRIQDMKEIADTLAGTTRVLTALLGAVAAVSLLVGGIGIMNIMLVSVTERTREIGIRLAVGATENDVLLQFLIEAIVLSSIGGVVGIVTSFFASIGMAALLGAPFSYDALMALIAFLFSAAVGVIFGYVPARKAARMDPIEALRHE